MRVNARLDEEHQKKLEALKQMDGVSVTAVVVEAIDLLYEKKVNKAKKMKDFLASDFIGCAEGAEDLSENYKDYLDQTLSNKHDHS
ncbi:hypothetical protein FKG94_06465 [Exilibacterium tricleocarpae]|uniref:CopG family transcriptional regulator n=1 Tax=Exilibacterium tricleocarpae TaxID=2591008 RepID=A0A545U496_9GAMM|nr:hypothetical protein [Exilibacterium tricleocarpae]TQV84295.1 hypothetical protein FKG94_06465 [Exilibacterium tricleocarpae]